MQFQKTVYQPYGLIWVLNDSDRYNGSPIKWEDFQLTWDNNMYKWDAVRWIAENLGSSPRKRKLKKLRRLKPEQYEQVIKLICNVKGVDYRITRTKRSGIKVTTDDIELLVNEIRRKRPELFLEKVNG